MQSISTNTTFPLSCRARKRLTRFGVENPGDLLSQPRGRFNPIDILGDLVIGPEIVKWAKFHGVLYGPAAEWLTLLDAAKKLSSPALLALWRASLVTKSPQEIDSEDVTMNITLSNPAKEEFRAWASDHSAHFGAPILVGLPLKPRKLVRSSGFSTAEEIASHTRDEFASLTCRGEKFLSDIEQWLEEQELRFAPPRKNNLFALDADLSGWTKSALHRLGIRHAGDLPKLLSTSFTQIRHCGIKTQTDIRTLALKHGVEIPP